MNEQNGNDLFARIDFGIKRGARWALAEHKKFGHSVSAWENGRVVQIQPEEIQFDEEEEYYKWFEIKRGRDEL